MVLAGSGIRPEAYGPHWPRLPSPASPAPTGLACPHRPRLPLWRGGGFGSGVESKRERMKKLNCLSIQEKENTRLIYREKAILGEAEYHNRSPKPSTSAGARPPPQHGGRRGPWGLQATGLMPAALDRWGLQAPIRHKSHRASGRWLVAPMGLACPHAEEEA